MHASDHVTGVPSSVQFLSAMAVNIHRLCRALMALEVPKARWAEGLEFIPIIPT